MENSILGGGSAGVIFHIQFFFIFFAPNGLKIIFRHWSFFMYRGGVPPWGSSSPPLSPLTHTKLTKPHVKANIAHVAAKIMCVATLIVRFVVKSAICEHKNLLAQRQVFHFLENFFFLVFLLVKILFFQCKKICLVSKKYTFVHF